MTKPPWWLLNTKKPMPHEVPEQLLEAKRIWRKFCRGMLAPFPHFSQDISYQELSEPAYCISGWLAWSSRVCLLLTEVAMGKDWRELAALADCLEKCCLHPWSNKSCSKNAVTFILNHNLFQCCHYLFTPVLRWRQVRCLRYIGLADTIEVCSPVLTRQETLATKKTSWLDAVYAAEFPWWCFKKLIALSRHV